MSTATSWAARSSDYTTVDTATGRVFTIDCYVYSPKNHKRNYVRGVEHLLYLLKFPEQPRQ